MNDINEIKGVKQKQFCTFITDLIWKTEFSSAKRNGSCLLSPRTATLLPQSQIFQQQDVVAAEPDRKTLPTNSRPRCIKQLSVDTWALPVRPLAATPPLGLSADSRGWGHPTAQLLSSQGSFKEGTECHRWGEMKKGLAQTQQQTNYPKREADGVPGAKKRARQIYSI